MTVYYPVHFFHPVFPYWFPFLSGHYWHMGVGFSCTEYMLGWWTNIHCALRAGWKPVCTVIYFAVFLFWLPVYTTLARVAKFWACEASRSVCACVFTFLSFCTVFQICRLCGELNCTLSVQCILFSPLHPFCWHVLQVGTIRLVCFAYLLRYKAWYRKRTVFDNISWECMQIHCCVGYNWRYGVGFDTVIPMMWPVQHMKMLCAFNVVCGMVENVHGCVQVCMG